MDTTKKLTGKRSGTDLTKACQTKPVHSALPVQDKQ
jgi:hypothetical protein